MTTLVFILIYCSLLPDYLLIVFTFYSSTHSHFNHPVASIGATMNPYTISGAIAGIAGLFTFLIIHHFTIQPIWEILPLGLPIALIGGLAVGWSFQEIHQQLPAYSWTFLGLILLIMLLLAPAMIIAQFTSSPFGLDGTLNPGYTAGRAAVQFILELLLTATLMGALAGWILGGSQRAMFATALAGFVYALGPGHNIPFLGNTPGVWKGVLLLLAINAVSELVMMFSLRWLAGRA